MTAVSQDFTIYAGDFALPIFQVKDGAGAPLDISAVSDIFWTAQRDLSTATVIAKSKTDGTIQLVNGGVAGQFSVRILAADSLDLSGFYLHQAKLLDDIGELSTVSTGRMQVARAPVWTYSGDPSASPRDAARYLIGDTIYTDQQFTDAEIDYQVTKSPTNLYRVAYALCLSLAAKFSRLVDTVDRDLRTMYSTKSGNYRAMAARFQQEAATGGGGMPFAGGISFADRQRQIDNTDRVPPDFNKGMQDNWVPDGIVGNEDGA